jgi:hypothetical protein
MLVIDLSYYHIIYRYNNFSDRWITYYLFVKKKKLVNPVNSTQAIHKLQKNTKYKNVNIKGQKKATVYIPFGIFARQSRAVFLVANRMIQGETFASIRSDLEFCHGWVGGCK